MRKIIAGIVIGLALAGVCTAGKRLARKPVRYYTYPTNCIVRIDGTNCYVRYMHDNLLNTNLIVYCQPFDPAPAPENNDNNEAGE